MGHDVNPPQRSFLYTQADYVPDSFKAGSYEKKAPSIYSWGGLSLGFQKERLKFDSIDGTPHDIAIQTLKPDEVSRNVKDNQVKGWLGLKKYFWKPLKITDSKGNEITILVNVNSAIKRLKSFGYSKNEIKESIREGTFLEKLQKHESKGETKNKEEKIADCFKNFALAQELRANIASTRREEKLEEKQLNEFQVGPEQQDKVKKDLLEWRGIGVKFGNSKTETEKDRMLMLQNYKINSLLESALNEQQKDADLMKKSSFRVVTDTSGKLQGAMLLKTKEKRNGKSIPLYVSYISTAPWNLRVTAMQGDKRKVSGAATALIESAILESIKTGTGGAVALESVPSAEEFYELLGFKKVDWTPGGKNLIPMELSPEAAQEFLMSNRAGRALPT